MTGSDVSHSVLDNGTLPKSVSTKSKKYQKFTGILCVQFACLILIISENIEISINPNINVSHMATDFNVCIINR